MARFEFKAGGSNKFWEIERSGAEVTTRWGRIGSAGQSKTKNHGSEAAGKKEHDRLVAEKTKEGYKPAGGARATAPKTLAPPSVAKPKAASQAPSTQKSKPNGAAHLFLEIGHHQLAFEDSKHRGQPFNFKTIDNGVEAQPFGVVMHLRRAAGSVPVLVEVLDAPPPASDLTRFHLVSEASFESPSGKLVLSSTAIGPEPTVVVPRGSLRLQARQADLDTSSYDGSDGADHYRVLIWQAPAAKTKVLLSRKLKDDVLLTPKGALADLDAGLGDADATIRCLTAVESVRHLAAGESAAVLLRRAAADKSPAVRATLTSALGLCGDKGRATALEILTASSKDRADAVRLRTPEALARLGGPEAARALLAFMAGADPEMAAAAADWSWKVSLAPADLLPLLRDKRPHCRIAALRVVEFLPAPARQGDELLKDAIRSLANDKDKQVRALASKWVEKVGDSPAALLKRLKARGSDDRESAARGLGKLGDAAAFEPLASTLATDKDIGVQRAAAGALGDLGDRRAVPLLAAHLENPTFNLNWECARSLGKLGGPEATRLLWKYASMPRAHADSGNTCAVLQPGASPNAAALAKASKFPELREVVFVFDEPTDLSPVLDAVKEPKYPTGLHAVARRIEAALLAHLRSQGFRPSVSRYFPYHGLEQIRAVCKKAGFAIPDRPEPPLGYIGREATDALVAMFEARARQLAGEEQPEDSASPDIDVAALDIASISPAAATRESKEVKRAWDELRHAFQRVTGR